MSACPWPESAGLQSLADAVEARGGTLLLTGGAVRDVLMGLGDPDDIDMVVTLPASDGVDFVTSLGWRHARHPFRGDTVFATDPEGHHLSLSFVGPMTPATLEADARQRDFTCNALYATRDGTVLDPLGRGVGDIAARRVAPASPDAFARDPVRILRYPRMRAKLGEAGDPCLGTVAAAREAAPLLRSVPPVRSVRELHKLLEGSSAARALDLVRFLDALGALRALLPDADLGLFEAFLAEAPEEGWDGHDARVLSGVLGIRTGFRQGVFVDGLLRGHGSDGLVLGLADAYSGKAGRTRTYEFLVPGAFAALRRLGASRKRDRGRASVPRAGRTMSTP